MSIPEGTSLLPSEEAKSKVCTSCGIEKPMSKIKSPGKTLVSRQKSYVLILTSNVYSSSSNEISSTSNFCQPIKSKCHHSDPFTLKPCFCITEIIRSRFFLITGSFTGVEGHASFLKESYSVGIGKSSPVFKSKIVISMAQPRLCRDPR